VKGARVLIKTKMARPKHLINNCAFYVPALSKDIHAVRAMKKFIFTEGQSSVEK